MKLLWLLLLPACSADMGVARSNIVNGSADSGDPAVVALATRRTRCGELPQVVCTGTLISDRAVLTAAHCLSRERRGFLEVFAGARVGGPGSFLPISAQVIHPSYRRGESDFDLAILWLSQPAAAAPVSLLSTPLDASSVGQPARVVGFGVAADAGAPGEKRTGTVLLQSVDPGSFTYGAGPSMTCQGDSGGPVLIMDKLAGVTSEGDLGCVSFGTAARADVRLADFIQPTLAAGPPAAGAIGLDALCSAECRDSADCPADLYCGTAADGTSRCLVPPLEPGSLGAACKTDGECGGGSCVPIGDDCRCSTPCGKTTSSGCEIGGAGGSLWSLFFLVAVVGMRRRRGGRRQILPLSQPQTLGTPPPPQVSPAAQLPH